MKAIHPSIEGAMLAAKFAREIGLPAGNRWEPPMARRLVKECETCTAESVEAQWRVTLGLEK